MVYKLVEVLWSTIYRYLCMLYMDCGGVSDEIVYWSNRNEPYVPINHGIIILMVYAFVKGLLTFIISMINCVCCVALSIESCRCCIWTHTISIAVAGLQSFSRYSIFFANRCPLFSHYLVSVSSFLYIWHYLLCLSRLHMPPCLCFAVVNHSLECNDMVCNFNHQDPNIRMNEGMIAMHFAICII